MEKLIARRPIQYLGRFYERGSALPANDPLMTAAWLKAGSAAWESPPAEEAGPAPDSGAALRREAERQAAETQAAGTLRALGVELTDGEGRYVGEERLKEQLCALAQTLLPDYEDVIPSEGTLSSGALPEEEDKILDVGPDGHFSRTSLARLTKAELLDLAKDLGVDLSGCRTNAERAEALAAVDAAAVLEKGSPDAPLESPPEEGAT